MEIPIGKYKGRLIDEIIHLDPLYLKWLLKTAKPAIIQLHFEFFKMLSEKIGDLRDYDWPPNIKIID